MAKHKLTEDYVQKLLPGQVFDTNCRGFGVRKFASGQASYFVKYSVGKQQRRLTLGSVVRGNLQEMRLEASKILVQAHTGVDVVADRKKAAAEAKKVSQVKTLGDLVPVYLRVREFGDDFWSRLRPKSLTEAIRYLTKAWQPLHAEPVDQITRQMVKARRDEIVSESGSATGNQALGALSVFFAWAIDREHVSGANPTADIKALKQKPRTRVLSEEELCVIWQACRDDDFGRIVKLLMLTGQRREEIGALESSEIIFMAKRQIELPAARCKNKQPHIIPLAPAAMELLRGIPSDGRYVFGPFKAWQRRKDDLDKRIAAARGMPLPQWTLHDIRRSVVTHIAELGFAQPHVIEAIVNHISGTKAGVAGVYNRATYLPEKREALERWGRYLTGLVGMGRGAPQVGDHLTADKNPKPETIEEIGGRLAEGTR